MIPKEFTKTYKLQKELRSLEEEEEKAIFKTENPDLADKIEANEHLYKNRQLEDLEADEQLRSLISENYNKENVKLNKSNKYFLGCSLTNYKHNYDERLKEFKIKYIDAIEHNFIFEELQNINKFNLPYYINDDIKKSIAFSIERTKEYLKERLRKDGYEIETSYNVVGEISSLAIKGNSVVKVNEEAILDLSNNTHKDKIIYLELLGFFNFIKEKEPQLSTNKIASLVSAITGIRQGTVQSYINPLLSDEVSQRNNPLKNKDNLAIIKNKLIELTVQNIKTIR